MKSTLSITSNLSLRNQSAENVTEENKEKDESTDPSLENNEEKKKSIEVDKIEEGRASIVGNLVEEERKSIAVDKIEEKRKSIAVDKVEDKRKSIAVDNIEDKRKSIPEDEAKQVSNQNPESSPKNDSKDEEHKDDEVLFRRNSILRDDSQEELDIEPIPVHRPVSHSHNVSFLSLMPSYFAKEIHGLHTKSITESRMELMERQKTFVTIFESIALGVIIEELELQLEILGHTFPGIFTVSDDAEFLTYDERFSMDVKDRDLDYIPTLKNFKNPFWIDESQIGTHFERMAAKIQKDRAFLHHIIILTKEEMIENRSFERLKENVRREDNRRHEEITLMERRKHAQEQVNRMNKKIAEYKVQSEVDENNRKELINHLRDQLYETKQKGYRDARYTRGKFGAKNDFIFGQLKHQSDLQKLKIKNLEIEMTRDSDSNINIEAWSEILCGEILRNTKEWAEKFDRDLEDIEKRIKEKNDSLRNQKLLMEDLNAEIEQNLIVLGPYEDEKIENFRLNHAARVIQRWWRRYMKKNKLYKKKKGKGKGKKGKGKGKGKGKKGKKGKKRR